MYDASFMKNACVIDWNYLGLELTKMTPESIGDLVVQKLDHLQENGMIILPEIEFSIDYLHIKKNWNIIGSQLTVMSISGGIVIGNFQQDIQNKLINPIKTRNIHVVFSEVTIKFEPLRGINTDRFSRKSTQKDWTLETPRLDPSIYDNTLTIDWRRDESYTTLFVSFLTFKFKFWFYCWMNLKLDKINNRLSE